ncbi:MAG: tetratricopeptide repeat protein [Pseudomonadota bacterium]|nr:tetratricopeptide repeat protein [Pseudomonadota bacterium]
MSAALFGATNHARSQGGRESDSFAPPPAPLTNAERARQRGEVLDRLFGRLRSAKSETEAKMVEQSIWQMWMRSGGATADLLLEQAVKSINARNYDRALDILDVVIDEAPKFAEAWNKRATVNYILGRLDRSLADIDVVLELEPRHFGALSGLGMIRRDRGDAKGALSAFRDALGINPHLANIRETVKTLEHEVEQEI